MSLSYPQNDLDRPRKVLGLLGSFWQSTYAGRQLIEDSVRARLEVDKTAQQALREAVASVSRQNVPIWSVRPWYVLQLLQSKMNELAATIWHFDDTDLPAFNALPGFTFDEALSKPYYAFQISTKIVDIPLITNRITDPSLVLVRNVDFWLLRPGLLVFRENPVNNELIARRNVYTDGVVTDVELTFWLFRPQFDERTVYRHFGYVIGSNLPTSKAAKSIVNHTWDAIVGGTAMTDVQGGFAATADIPLVATESETVTDIDIDNTHKIVATDKNVYVYNSNATITAKVGDKVKLGDSLIREYEASVPNDGTPPQTVTGLTLDAGYLDAGFDGELTFPNADTAWQFDTAGRPYFTVSGHPFDVTLFWETVYANAAAAGTTFGALLQGKYGTMPNHVNPLRFLLENIIRGNLTLIHIYADAFGDDAIGALPAGWLRKLVPPHEAVIAIIELPAFSDSGTIVADIDMGYFTAMEVGEDAVTAGVVAESIDIRSISFTCH